MFNKQPIIVCYSTGKLICFQTESGNLEISRLSLEISRTSLDFSRLSLEISRFPDSVWKQMNAPENLIILKNLDSKIQTSENQSWTDHRRKFIAIQAPAPLAGLPAAIGNTKQLFFSRVVTNLAFSYFSSSCISEGNIKSKYNRLQFARRFNVQLICHKTR